MVTPSNAVTTSAARSSGSSAAGALVDAGESLAVHVAYHVRACRSYRDPSIVKARI